MAHDEPAVLSPGVGRTVEEAVTDLDGSRVDERAFVVLLCHDLSGRLLLIRQWRPTCNDWIVGFPGGHVEHGESAREAAVRECREETGLRPGVLHELGEFVISPRTGTRAVVFVAMEFDEAPLPPDFDEEIDLAWVAVSEFEDRIEGGTVIDGPTLASWALCRNKLEEVTTTSIGGSPGGSVLP